MKKMVGVIGGMGPSSTVDYMQQIIKLILFDLKDFFCNNID